MLNIQNEDQLLQALGIWYDVATVVPLVITPNQIAKNDKDSYLEEILENVNWHYVSLNGLFSMMSIYPNLRGNEKFLTQIKC